MPGPAPKPPSKRRNRGTPKSYGAAQPLTVPAAAPDVGRTLGIDDPHPFVQSMWTNVQQSCEAAFYSEADWARLRLELWYANSALRSSRPISGHTWAAIQHGLNALLISPAEKRRCAIEMRAPVSDADEARVVSQLDKYRQALKPV
jgi:hypothetical protein